MIYTKYETVRFLHVFFWQSHDLSCRIAHLREKGCSGALSDRLKSRSDRLKDTYAP